MTIDTKTDDNLWSRSFEEFLREPGKWQWLVDSSMGIGGISGWLFSILTGSILMTWLFNMSRGSVLAVALFHGVLDIVMTSPVKGALPSIMGAIITIFGFAIPVVFGRANLSRHSRVQDLGT